MKKNLTIIRRGGAFPRKTLFDLSKPCLRPDSFSMSHSLTRKLVLLPMIILANSFYSLILMHFVSSPSENTTDYYGDSPSYWENNVSLLPGRLLKVFTKMSFRITVSSPF